MSLTAIAIPNSSEGYYEKMRPKKEKRSAGRQIQAEEELDKKREHLLQRTLTVCLVYENSE